jgi:hypothetical protein
MRLVVRNLVLLRVLLLLLLLLRLLLMLLLLLVLLLLRRRRWSLDLLHVRRLVRRWSLGVGWVR